MTEACVGKAMINDEVVNLTTDRRYVDGPACSRYLCGIALPPLGAVLRLRLSPIFVRSTPG